MAGFGAPGKAEFTQCFVESKLGVREQLGEAMVRDFQSVPKKIQRNCQATQEHQAKPHSNWLQWGSC